MNLELAERVARAVLYEGYILYPYTPSSLKNQQRWTFGGIFPQAYTLAQGGADPCWMQTEVLLRSTPTTRLDCRVRFLHLQEHSAAEAAARLSDSNGGADFRPVESLQVGSRLYVSWQEAVECESSAQEIPLQDLLAQPYVQTIAFPDVWRTELLPDPEEKIAGAILRRQYAVAGSVEISAASLDALQAGLVKVSVRISNLTPLEEEQAPTLNREEALLRAFVSTHTLLGVHDGEFISSFDPPPALRPAAAACANVGSWPVLVGEAGESDLMLSSPIILYDYPETAPESPGDLFDATEIDEILTLRILTLTDAEKEEIRRSDEHGRALLERTEVLSPEQLRALHGTLRGLRPVGRGL